MKYSYNWVQSHIEDPLPTPETLRETIIFHAFEVEQTEFIDGDTIFDIKVLPDRAGDCLSHHGMAREIAGLLDLNFNAIEYTTPTVSAEVPIDVQTDTCLRYAAVRIDDVRVGPSPEWLVKKLEAVGQRSINNVVDATNFILLDLGQPAHVFDADKVSGSIVVREIRSSGESITLLGGEEKLLKEGMMVIADEKKALAIAGVKGGTAAEVTSDTTSIILEIANFDATSVRKTSRTLGLPTDASKRFENNLAPYVVESARAKLIGLVQILAGGTVVAAGDYYPHPQTAREISFTLTDIQRLLGHTITDAHIVKVLDRYGYSYQKNAEQYVLHTPLWRHDITGAHDMAEEIGRVIGYENIPAASLPFTPTIEFNEQYEKIRAIKFSLSAQGYSEVMTYSFRKKGDVYIAYGSKDKSALRSNLSDALKESHDMNRLNAALLGVEEVKIFEVGTVFAKDGESVHVATADKHGVKEWSVEEYPLEEVRTSGVRVANTAPASFIPWSPYPFITRDIAVWVSNEDASQSLQTMVTDFARQHCARPAVLFDTFNKEDKTSMAYRLVFQSPEKTLTDGEVEIVFKTLVSDIQSRSDMEIR
ncbi:MAG: Phenylalanine--tRNA ligase beta subunit [Candidatus Nomurabacteria bacterium]|nr:Phenylalanine--tRNA ligase beta subunit [Candidatus Nomurabacteria bacterium]